jgi:hypothetical protein
MRRRTRTVARRTRYGSTLPHQRITMIDSDEGPWMCCCRYASAHGRWPPCSACRSRASPDPSLYTATGPAPGRTVHRCTCTCETEHPPLDTGPASIPSGPIKVSLSKQFAVAFGRILCAACRAAIPIRAAAPKSADGSSNTLRSPTGTARSRHRRHRAITLDLRVRRVPLIAVAGFTAPFVPARRAP